MIFDDHEVGDDWNISEAWVEEMRHQPWWNDQIIGGYASYWVYQHLGNLSPEVLKDDNLYKMVKDADDAWPVLREFASRTHRVPDGNRWSYSRDLGDTRLLMIDSRGGRRLSEGNRSMVDAEEWAWISDRATGGFDHLLIGTSLPLLLGPAMHHLQSWNERLCSGAWGKRAARWAENLRRSQDLDHWASFHDSFTAMVELLEDLASGKKGHPPSTVLVLSGDVHHGYLAEATLENSAKSRIYQAVCSPLRNALPAKKSYLQGRAWAGIARLAFRLLARLAGVAKEPLTWRLAHDAAFFDNQVATLDSRRPARFGHLRKGRPRRRKEPSLQKLYEHRLA